MKKSGVRCAHAFLIASLFSLVGCSEQGGDGLVDKNVSIDLVEPPCAEPGSAAGYIEGNGFGAENVTITVGGIEAEVLSATGGDASFVVPENVPPGPIEVIVTNPGGQIAQIDWVTCITDFEVARIEITPAAITLTHVGESYQLTAQAYNAASQAIPADFAWTSLDTDEVEVTEGGLVIAAASIGSAQIVAEAEGVSSSPAIVAIARPVAGALLVPDSQVVEGPSYDGDPDAFGVGSQVQLILEGLARPELGDIVLPRETLSIGGRVVGVEEPTPGVFAVALEVLPLDGLYDEYSVDEIIQLDAADAVPGELVDQFYEGQLQPDGSYLFVLRSAATAPKAVGKKIFTCKASPENLDFAPLQVDALPASISIQQNISLVVKWDSNPNTEDRLGLRAEIEGNLSSKVVLNAVVEGKYTCEAELLRLPIPVFPVGPFYAGGIVPVGLGFEFGGKLTVAGLGMEFGIKPKATAEFGLRCPVGQDCDVYGTGSVDVEPSFKWVFPDLSTVGANIRVEPSITGFGYAKLEIGVDLLVTRVSLSVFKSRAGPVQTGNFAFLEGQLLDPAYKSDYKLSFDITAGLDVDVEPLLGILSVNTPQQSQFKLSGLLFQSPQLAEAKADANAYAPQDTVTFDVRLTPEDVYYLPFQYNVDEVIIYELRELAGGQKVASEIASATPNSSGQTDFTIQWTPITAGTIDNNFFAAVETSLLPKLPDPLTMGILELGSVMPPPIETVCDDTVDDDGDGDTDCADSDCASDPVCAVETVCDDGLDDDSDGDTDCADSDCASDPVCAVETVCDDGLDDDGDGDTDCADADCSTSPLCCSPYPDCLVETVCDDGVDNDGDGFADCSDFADCRNDSACAAPVETNCSNGIDDDFDGSDDCADLDCYNTADCEICDNGIDDDGDGDIDCDDAHCTWWTGSSTKPSICSDCNLGPVGTMSGITITDYLGNYPVYRARAIATSSDAPSDDRERIRDFTIFSALSGSNAGVTAHDPAPDGSGVPVRAQFYTRFHDCENGLRLHVENNLWTAGYCPNRLECGPEVPDRAQSASLRSSEQGSLLTFNLPEPNNYHYRVTVKDNQISNWWAYLWRLDGDGFTRVETVTCVRNTDFDPPPNRSLECDNTASPYAAQGVLPPGSYAAYIYAQRNPPVLCTGTCIGDWVIGQMDYEISFRADDPREICDNAIDDNGNGDLDCDDFDCIADPSCP